MKKLLAALLAMMMLVSCVAVAMADEGSEPDWTEYNTLIAEVKAETDFTEREADVLRELVGGASNEEIAQAKTIGRSAMVFTISAESVFGAETPMKTSAPLMTSASASRPSTMRRAPSSRRATRTDSPPRASAGSSSIGRSPSPPRRCT